jgi:cytochrome c2
MNIHSGGWEMKKTSIGSLAAAIIALCIIAFSQDSTVEHGKEVFVMQKCDLCHSISGTGGKMSALDGVGSKLNPNTMKKWIRTPKEMKSGTVMKPYPNLPERDLNDLIAYLMTLK